MRLLALDTATEQCSVALVDGSADSRLFTQAVVQPRMHGVLVLPMIDAVLAEAGLVRSQLDVIAFGRGPGAFTGVRLAVSVAQGLGFALDRPLLAVSDLRAVAAQVLWQPGAAARIVVCQDARMQEVYWGCFERIDGRIAAAGPESVGPAAAVAVPAAWVGTGDAAGRPREGGSAYWGAGSGFGEYTGFGVAPAQRFADVLPHAREIALLALADGLAAAVPPDEALPVYLRDDVAAPSSRN